MGNTASTPPAAIDNEKLGQSGYILGSILIGLVIVIIIIIVIFQVSKNFESIKHGVSGALSTVSSVKAGGVTHLPWDKIIPIFLTITTTFSKLNHITQLFLLHSVSLIKTVKMMNFYQN
jgi:hypothetical protein